ncbi:MAG: STAS/SEC14 domain-containing protein [Candidatus Binatia bacterium]
MPVEIIDASGKLLQARVWAVLRKDDYDRMIQVAKESIAREGKIRVLIVLEAFGGWERRADWGDVTFITEHSKDIEKMALVGEEKWKDDAFAFTGKGFRSTNIEFFTPSRLEEARAWLSS